MMVYVLPIELKDRIDTDFIKALENVYPINTVRVREVHGEHIKSVLGADDLSEYLMDVSEVTMWNDEQIP